jgi:D-glycero-D-manno-heptose 1,7-bisphosphate phosphatase
VLYLFDMDGTLRRPRLPLPSPVIERDQRILPGRRERLRQLDLVGHHLAAASNQAVVAMGLVSSQRCEQIMEETNRRLGGVLRWIRFCPHHPMALRSQYRRRCRCRKPAPGLLQEAMQTFQVAASQTIYVGNGKRDVAAAAAAGVQFVRASDFFGR